MEQFIAPKMLVVDGKQSPCKCHDNVICEYCVQANLRLWEREEGRGPQIRPGRLVNTLKKLRKGHVAEMMGMHRNTVRNILKSNKIPSKYAQRFYRGIEKGVSE